MSHLYNFKGVKLCLYISRFNTRAADGGYLDIVQTLHQHGADVNRGDDCYGNTPLYMAAKHGRLDVVKYLVQQGRADINIKNKEGETPVEVVKSAEVANFFMEFLVKTHKTSNMASLAVAAVRKENAVLLNSLFSLSIEDHVEIFGVTENYKKPLHLRTVGGVDIFGAAEDNKIPLHLRTVDGKTFLEHMADKGDLMTKHREDLLSVLEKVDIRVHGHPTYQGDVAVKEGGADRLVSQLKRGMPTSPQLSTWIESVKSRYPISSSSKWAGIIKSFILTAIMGMFLFCFDMASDVIVNQDFLNNIKLRNTSNDTNGMCTHIDNFKDYLIINECKNFKGNYLLDCLENNSNNTEARKNWTKTMDICKADATEEWEVLYYVTLSHLILPWVFYWVMASLFLHLVSTTRWSKMSWKKKITTLLLVPIVPVVTKFKQFVFEVKLASKRAENPYVEKFKQKKIKEIAQINQELETCSKNAAVMLMLEVSTEASFQFYLQTLLLLPNIILAILKAYTSGGSLLDQVVDFRMISATSSFLVVANSYIKIKNLNKKEAMTGPNIITILIKTTLDTVSRIIIIAMFIHLYNDGNFNTLLATSIYYGHVVIMLIFNVLFNTSKSFNESYFFGLLLNSLSSFFNLNVYNYDDILFYNYGNSSAKHNKKNTQYHQPSFLHQAAFYTIFLGENMILTALSLAIEEPSRKLKDGLGIEEKLTSGNVCLFLDKIYHS